MAGRRWAQGRPADEPDGKARPRPSERGQAPAGGGTKPSGAASSKSASSKPVTGRRGPKVSDEALARARAKLEPPKAPWHPLPLAEAAIAIGFLAVLLAAALADRDGIFAGFLLIMLGTAEFSWREHRHGYRPHATVLAVICGFTVGGIAWRTTGLGRDACLGIGLAVFLFAWGILDREYVPAYKRAKADADDGAGTGDGTSV